MELRKNYEQLLAMETRAQQLEQENQKLKNELTRERKMRTDLGQEHEEELRIVLHCLEEMEDEKQDIENILNNNRTEISQLQRDLKSKGVMIDDLYIEQEDTHREMIVWKEKARQSIHLEKRVKEVEEMNDVMFEKERKVLRESSELKVRLSQLKVEKSDIQKRLERFKTKNKTLFSRRNLLGQAFLIFYDLTF